MTSHAAAHKPTTVPVERELVVFGVGEHLCAIPVEDIQEIIRNQSATRVFLAPEYVVGVLNLRGQIVTIVDMRRKFGMADGVGGGDARIIIIDVRLGERVGLLVDRVDDIVAARSDDIEPPPSNIGQGLERIFKGVFKARDALIALLDAGEVIKDP